MPYSDAVGACLNFDFFPFGVRCPKTPLLNSLLTTMESAKMFMGLRKPVKYAGGVARALTGDGKGPLQKKLWTHFTP